MMGDVPHDSSYMTLIQPYLSRNGKGTVHIEQSEGLPGLLALRHGTKEAVLMRCKSEA